MLRIEDVDAGQEAGSFAALRMTSLKGEAG
jgi:hypothetical protein